MPPSIELAFVRRAQSAGRLPNGPSQSQRIAPACGPSAISIGCMFQLCAHVFSAFADALPCRQHAGFGLASFVSVSKREPMASAQPRRRIASAAQHGVRSLPLGQRDRSAPHQVSRNARTALARRPRFISLLRGLSKVFCNIPTAGSLRQNDSGLGHLLHCKERFAEHGRTGNQLGIGAGSRPPSASCDQQKGNAVMLGCIHGPVADQRPKIQSALSGIKRSRFSGRSHQPMVAPCLRPLVWTNWPRFGTRRPGSE